MRKSKSEFHQVFGLKLRFLRESFEMTQQQVADILHLHRSTYAYYELGISEPSLATLRNLAILFGISLDDLLDINTHRNKKLSQRMRRQGAYFDF